MITGGPKVQLIDATRNPYNLSIASARTCYSNKGIIFPQDVDRTEKDRQLRERIARETKKAGHLTTRQHAQFVFAIRDLSRQSLWSYLHSHPYYNSEQVSQRYVEVEPGAVVLPPLSGKGKEIYRDTVMAQVEAYQALIDLLSEPVEKEYFKIFPGRGKKKEKWRPTLHKKAIEIARYVLPVGTSAFLYHTVNGLTLHRYRKLSNYGEPCFERKLLIDQMVREVEKWDPLFFAEMDEALPMEDSLECKLMGAKSLTDGVYPGTNKELNRETAANKTKASSALVSYSKEAERVIVDSLEMVLGRDKRQIYKNLGLVKNTAYISDSEIEKALIDEILSPGRNPLWGDTLNPSVLSPVGRILDQVSFTFQKTLSHTADSQDQRHRTVIGARPILSSVYNGNADYIVPRLLEESDEARQVYIKIMKFTFERINILLDMNEKIDEALLLLPNGYPIRFNETGTLLAHHHKWKLRSCYLAQEEIFDASVQEITQVKKLFPNIGKHLKAPCWLRKESGLTPYCPEGARFCGVQVWKKEIEEYERII